MTTHSRDYNKFRSTFRVEDLAARFAGDFENGLNACYECCDRHAGSHKVACPGKTKMATAPPTPSTNSRPSQHVSPIACASRVLGRAIAWPRCPHAFQHYL